MTATDRATRMKEWLVAAPSAIEWCAPSIRRGGRSRRKWAVIVAGVLGSTLAFALAIRWLTRRARPESDELDASGPGTVQPETFPTQSADDEPASAPMSAVQSVV